MIEKHPDPELIKIFAHMVSATDVWLNRAEGLENPIVLFPDWSLEEVHARHEDGLARLMRVVESTPLDREIVYKTSQGQEFKNRFGEILLHLHSHSAYHRGQIAQEVRRTGGELLDTDFILALREVD